MSSSSYQAYTCAEQLPILGTLVETDQRNVFKQGLEPLKAHKAGTLPAASQPSGAVNRPGDQDQIVVLPEAAPSPAEQAVPCHPLCSLQQLPSSLCHSPGHESTTQPTAPGLLQHPPLVHSPAGGQTPGLACP